MVDIPRSSFIPRESSGMTPGKVRRTRTFHVFGFIATTMLIGSLVTAGGVYLLDRSAQNNLVEAKQNLQKLKDDIKEEHVAEIREFDRRVQAADLLIRNHISPLRIFDALEKYTKQKVQFTGFTLEHSPSLEVIVEIQGKTPEFKTLALQEASFGADTLLKNIVFSEVSTSDGAETEEGGTGERSVLFSLKGVLDTSKVLYDGNTKRSIEQAAFLEVGDSLIAVEGDDMTDGEVLGEAIIAQPL
jgi:hypothetical protein